VIVKLLVVALLVVLLNIPFGAWRSRVRKFSLRWFLAVHIPVPFVIALRLGSGLGYSPLSIVVLVGAFFLGQWFGARL